MGFISTSVAKIGTRRLVCHDGRNVDLLDKVGHLAGLFSDFINEELGDEIWDWQCTSLGCRLLISTSSGYSKLQGAGVRCHLVHRGIEVLLDGAGDLSGGVSVTQDFIARELRWPCAPSFA